MLSIGILASGEGSTLEGLAEGIERAGIRARIVLVVADRPGAAALDRARRLGIPTRIVEVRALGLEAGAEAITRELRSSGVELVVLAGWLTILPERWLADWQGRAINLHPSLLPRYGGRGMYGLKVHAAVLAADDSETGATIHLVTSEVDGGPPLIQGRIPVLPKDTPASLRARLAPVEVELLLELVAEFADGRRTLPHPVRLSRAMGAARP